MYTCCPKISLLQISGGLQIRLKCRNKSRLTHEFFLTDVKNKSIKFIIYCLYKTNKMT